MLKSSGKVRPMAESSETRRERWSVSASQTVRSPTDAAPRIRSGEVRLCVARKARTIPSRSVWVIASDIMDIRRNTRKQPGSAQATATSAAIS